MIGRFVMKWASSPPKSPEEIREFLKYFEDVVRKDERERLASFINGLGNKVMLEFEAYQDYLNDRSGELPEQIKLELPE